MKNDGWEIAQVTGKDYKYPKNPERFTDCVQVLSKEPLTGKCYFEVQCTAGALSDWRIRTVRERAKETKPSWDWTSPGFVTGAV